MILSDKTIYKYLESGELIIDPMEIGQVQPASVDIRLGSSFLKLDENSFEAMTLTDEIKYISIQANEIIIPSNSFLLATTMEYIKPVSYTHLRAHETDSYLVCRLLLEKK